MIYSSFDVEVTLWEKGFELVCGVDEVGRGCFAGPIIAGVVVFPKNFQSDAYLADSKLLTARKREELSLYICENSIYSLGEASVEEINECGITRCLQIAYKKAIDSLEREPDYYLIDAYNLDWVEENKQKGIIKGDRISSSIAAASIIAKVYRDAKMVKLADEYKGYGFDVNKGYGTLQHRQAIKRLGLCEAHRKCFKLDKFL